MIPFENTKIIKQGIHKPQKEGSVCSSSVILIKSKKNIIVDTGAFAGDDKKIINSLKKERLKAEDIDIVIATHYDWDHIGNINLFKNAILYKCYAHTTAVDLKTNHVRHADIEDGFEVAEGVSLMMTPGHLEHHMSVVVHTDKGKIVIAGDAIAKEEYLKKYPRFCWNRKEYGKSRKSILKIADYIIPGHGDMFKIDKKNK